MGFQEGTEVVEAKPGCGYAEGNIWTLVKRRNWKKWLILGLTWAMQVEHESILDVSQPNAKLRWTRRDANRFPDRNKRMTWHDGAEQKSLTLKKKPVWPKIGSANTQVSAQHGKPTFTKFSWQ